MMDTAQLKKSFGKMINGKRIAVVMPAYNAEKTLEVTVGELPDLVDICILVDDHSSDSTVTLARRLGGGTSALRSQHGPAGLSGRLATMQPTPRSRAAPCDTGIAPGGFRMGPRFFQILGRE